MVVTHHEFEDPQIESRLKYSYAYAHEMADKSDSRCRAAEGRATYEHDDCCSCTSNPPGTTYYVSVIDGPKFGLPAGPFKSHFEALDCVGRAKEQAYRVDPRSIFYAFGTTAMRPKYRKPGKLNDLLGLKIDEEP